MRISDWSSDVCSSDPTVTRATIENIADFDNLQSVLQDFNERPEEASFAALKRGIDRQERGVATLEELLVTQEDRQRIDVVTQMAPAMRERAAALWAIKEKRDANRHELGARLGEVKELGVHPDKRIGNLRRKFEGQERDRKSP